MTDEPPDDHRTRDRTNLIVFCIAALIVVASVALILMMKRDTARQECIAAGHHNCSPVETGQ